MSISPPSLIMWWMPLMCARQSGTHCKRNKVPIITIGGAGGQIDPTQIQLGDLAKTIQDPLAAKVRSDLRRFYNLTKNTKRQGKMQNMQEKIANIASLWINEIITLLKQMAAR
ncbi:hypothetical protein Q4519_15245 [Motilimonas sp. 1_MG-2023]|uniref:hypothetical protein n=1 Tax=Motilimonas sp. 1_MG-2023 TaxID=3062672 RepID=UPI0026E47992|nr:hypothetical protein [Motilimonas sp. 1_MG-2023]MDO6527035.1 hypothetical protein [Motilimonas sp. 1_MG-2023]